MRQVLLPILLAMLGGLGTTIVIAWGAVLWRPAGRPDVPLFRVDSEGQRWMGPGSNGPGWSVLTVYGTWEWYIHDGWEPPLPDWMAVSRDLPPDERAAHGVAAGWPFRCFAAHAAGRGDDTPVNGVWRSGLGPQQVHWESWRWAIAWRSANQPAADVPSMKVLPLRPLWPGLVGNVLFWSLLWSIPWLASVIRRAVRRRRGRCAACGYDLRGRENLGVDSARCPECGQAATIIARTR